MRDSAAISVTNTAPIRWLEHRPIGKATHESGTAEAHVRYVDRESACSHTIGERMPINSFAAQRFMQEHEKQLRKNGRVCDRVYLALPRCMDEEQRDKLVLAFAAKISSGKAPWRASFHDQGKDAHNPHAHIIFVDRDPETGKRCCWSGTNYDGTKRIGLSEKNSTDHLSRVWKATADEHLERAGFAWKLGDKERDKASELEVDSLDEEEDMLRLATSDGEIVYEGLDKEYLDGRINRLLESAAELKEYNRQVGLLNSLKARVKELEGAVSHQRESYTQAAADAANKVHEYAKAQEQADQHKDDGFQLFGWKSAGRKKAEQLAEIAAFRRDAMEAAKETAHEKDAKLAELKGRREETWRQIDEYEKSLGIAREDAAKQQRILGKDSEIETARPILENSFVRSADNLSRDEILDGMDRGDIPAETGEELLHLKHEADQKRDDMTIQISDRKRERDGYGR